MAQPVWVLSVDLQTKTATFQSGMADAAKSARSAFKDIQGGSSAMNREVGVNMFEARHGVMLLAEEFGVHLPRALTSFIADIQPVGAALEAAFPFLAIAVGATLLIEHLVKMKEAGKKLTEDQLRFGTAAANAFNSLDEKMLRAGIKADELNQNHLGALRKELELIDKQSLAELAHQFGELAKASDVVFADLKRSWYQVGAGSAGAHNALTQFKTEYDLLLAQGKDKEASDLLKGTRESAERSLALIQKAVKESQANQDAMPLGIGSMGGDVLNAAAAAHAVKLKGLKEELSAQQQLTSALSDQERMEKGIADLKNVEKSNATRGAGQKTAEEDWQRFLIGHELIRQDAKVRREALKQRQQQEIQDIEQGEKGKIEATEKGSAERLAAINAAIKKEEEYGLQENAFYRELLIQRIAEEKEMRKEADKQRAEAGREAAEHTAKMGELALAAEKERQVLIDSSRRMTIQKRIAEEVKAANADYALKMTAFSQEIAALNKHDKDYENKLKAIQNKQKQLTQAHENDITRIKDQAQLQRNTRILTAEQHMQEEVARGLAQTLMRHQSFGSMMASIGDQIVSGAIQNALMLMTVQGRERFSDARTAAASGYAWGMKHGGPIAPVLAAATGALAFASVMAFEGGGMVPGVGRGDIVPAMLTPGEAILPKKLMDRINSGPEASGGNHYHVHVRPTYNVNTIDGDGMQAALNKHTDVLQQHFEKTLRKMNR